MPKVTMSLTARMVGAMEDATRDVDWSDPNARESAMTSAAQAAREAMSTQVQAYATALRRACIDRRHPGSVPDKEGMQGTPCSRCTVRLKHVTEVQAVIAPDKPE